MASWHEVLSCGAYTEDEDEIPAGKMDVEQGAGVELATPMGEAGGPAKAEMAPPAGAKVAKFQTAEAAAHLDHTCVSGSDARRARPLS